LEARVFYFPMSLVELVQVRTADGVRLDGALAVPKHADPKHAEFKHVGSKAADSKGEASVDAVLAVHGTGSSFYSSTLLEGLMPKLLADGIAVLRVNTRGHDIVSTAATLHGPLRLGSALETVDECRHDLIAWLEFLASRNYGSVALVGHSLGAIKAIYTAARAAHPALRRLIAISPPRLSHAYYLESEKREEFLAQYRMAKEHAAAGHGEALMEIKTPLSFLVSAASFLDKYGPEEKYNFLREIGRLNVPTLFVYGSVELEEVGFRGLPEAISAATSLDAAEKISVVSVAGANHVYTGQIDELSHKVRAWLAKS
jgi:pimeloyl-ACP methyl ester carboxylesterase